MFFDPRKLRRAKTEDVRNVLFSTPKHAWKPPRQAVDGVDFKIHSALELDRVYRAFSAQFRGLSDIVPPRLERWSRVRSAGPFTRTDELAADQTDRGSTFALESAGRGAVYVDVKDRTYLHFGMEQLPQAGLSAALLDDPPEWKVAATKSKLTLSARGSLSLDVVIEYGRSGRKVGDVAARILAACLPGIDGLAKLGLPFAPIAAAGVPSSIETWLVNAKGQRGERLARHRVSNVEVGAIDPSAFAIPKGYRNLRDAKPGDKRTWHSVGSPHRRTRRAKPARRASKARAFASATQYQATLGQFFPPTLVVSPEPAFPEYLPATLHVSSALEIRQALLDGIRFMVNVMSRRLDTATGARVDADDPENTDVELTIDWLDQLERFHREQGDVGDGLFCLLRDPPREDDPTSGGEGLLDRMAATLARDLVAAEEPIPLGGDDDPVDLPAAIEDEIAALAGDAAIAADQRFDALLPESQAAVREAVLRQRIATLDYLFDGDFGEQRWPHVNYDLVHVKLQLEELAVEFADDDAIRRLVITLADSDSNKPRIELELALARFDATLSMDRWPGGWFWVTAAGVLVALSIVGSLAVTALILTLIGLGPVGWLVLLLLISQAPVATVAGGAVLLAAVTYLVWDATALRLTLEQPVLHASFDPDRASDPDEVVLDPDRVTLDGEITVSVSSEIPSGIHQLFDAIVNLAVPHFDTNVREVLESVIENGFASALRRLPHFLLSPPFDAQVPVGVTGADFDHVDADAPKHELLEMGTNGVEQWLLAETAVTRMAFPFADFGPTRTQVDRDLREALAQRMQQVETAGDPPYLGYAISQNQLNGNVYAQWLAGRFVRDYDSTQVEDAFATLIAALPESADVTSREVHAWAAAAPIVSVTQRAYLEQEARPYLAVTFPDIRVCLAGVAGKAATLELQCSVESIAHLGLGGLGNGDVRTLFTLERDFVHVLFDDRTEFVRVSPVSTQGIVAQGPVFDVIAAMEDAGRLQLLANLQPVLATAARRLLRRNSHEQVVFLPESPRVDQQIYDGVALANIAPRRASLLVVISTFGAMRIMLPRFDAEGNTEYFGMDFDALSCEEGIEFRSNV